MACTSIKANMGHLETAAAAAGLMSLCVVPLTLGCVAPNASLRALNAHLTTLVSSSENHEAKSDFLLQIEVNAGYDTGAKEFSSLSHETEQISMARLSSFGFSGTIAHAQIGLMLPSAFQETTKLLSRNHCHRADASHSRV